MGMFFAFQCVNSGPLAALAQREAPRGSSLGHGRYATGETIHIHDF